MCNLFGSPPSFREIAKNNKAIHISQGNRGSEDFFLKIPAHVTGLFCYQMLPAE